MVSVAGDACAMAASIWLMETFYNGQLPIVNSKRAFAHSTLHHLAGNGGALWSIHRVKTRAAGD